MIETEIVTRRKELNIIDRKLIDFIIKNKKILFLIIITILSLGIRYGLRHYQSEDYNIFLLNWCKYLQENGGFKGIKTISADYNVTYLYVLAMMTYLPLAYLTKIKMVSILFDFITAVGAYLIVKTVAKDYKYKELLCVVVYSLILINPVVIMNGSIWAQCDIIYTCFIIYSLYFILRRRYCLSFILYGVAFALKLQAILIFPIYIILYLKRKEFSIINFLWILVVNVILFMPAVLIGRPINSIFSAYTTQMNTYKYTVLKYPNIYNLLPDKYDLFCLPGILFTASIIGILIMIVISKDIELTDFKVIELSLLIVLIMTYFLPAMHERYAFIADILVVIYFVLKRDKPIIPIAITIITINSYSNELFKTPYPVFPFSIAAIVQLGIIIMLLFECFNFKKKIIKI